MLQKPGSPRSTDPSGLDVSPKAERQGSGKTSDLEKSFARMDRVVERFGLDQSLHGVPLLAQTVALVLKANGLDAAQRIRPNAHGMQIDSIQDAAHIFGARVRQVVLPSNWWTRDHGHFVGFLADAEEGSEPENAMANAVALINTSSGGYQLISAVGHEPVKVTEDLARQLKPVGYEIHPSLPQGVASLVALARFVLPSIRRELTGIAFFGGLIAALGALVPIATALVIDTLIPGLERNLLAELGVALALIALLNYVLSITRQRLILRANGKSKLLFASAIWNTLLALPVSFFKKHSPGDVQERFRGLLSLREIFISIVLNSLLTVIFSFFYFCLMYFYDSRLSFIALAYVTVLVVASFFIGLYLRKDHQKITELDGWLSGYVFQIFSGIVKLRASASESRFLARWADKYASRQAASLRTGHRSGQFGGLLELYAGLGMAALFSASFFLAGQQFSAGSFIAFLAAFGSFQSAFQGIGALALEVIALQPEWQRGKLILETEAETSGHLVEPGKLSGAIELSSVRFGYTEGQEVIKGISLSITPGEHVAIVGASGSGKSTLMRLMLGLEKIQSGTITYDNQDLANLDLPLLRRQIGVVTQDGKVHAGTIIDNIRGATNIDHERCLNACIEAGLGKDLAGFPMGLHTPLTEGGASLSGGQRQRILIARALVQQPSILFLDEATSALDNRTQALVTESLEKLNITRIVIAHRLSTIINADRIFVLGDGELLDSGTYEELLASSDVFSKMVKRQIV